MTNREMLRATYAQYLAALANWLRKAAAPLDKAEADALLSARLAPDMFPLATQVRFACVQAVEGLCRLRDEDFPPLVAAMLDEGRRADDAPGTIDGALVRIEGTLAWIDALVWDADDGSGSRQIAHELPMGMIFDLTEDQYVRDWALPQFYFHVMTAYAILRANGVALGKADYVPHMFVHVRPGTMPPGMTGQA
ncbi:DUF1993 domain-containing protein [Croceicoccus sp. BE223]|uniref:DUF1993 domain-containing protein n=1 Tax=Croceicoccus sp. BE223 TaxID=2817716 RepID=UPI00286178E4|nr:DUF1993 domain-containing protein [Croceicoccus sp. BE223]MDR7102074.1 hypothetical protein [Croceicoccus sp. BE223]